MQQIININGYETVIEIPEGQPGLGFSTRVEGNEDAYKIHYSENLVEQGGVATIDLNTETNGLTEGHAVIRLDQPMYNWLTTQVTVNDVPNRVGERANIIKKDNQTFEIWASVNGSGSAQIKVNWTVKGLL